MIENKQLRNKYDAENVKSLVTQSAIQSIPIDSWSLKKRRTRFSRVLFIMQLRARLPEKFHFRKITFDRPVGSSFSCELKKMRNKSRNANNLQIWLPISAQRVLRIYYAIR